MRSDSICAVIRSTASLCSAIDAARSSAIRDFRVLDCLPVRLFEGADRLDGGGDLCVDVRDDGHDGLPVFLYSFLFALEFALIEERQLARPDDYRLRAVRARLRVRAVECLRCRFLGFAALFPKVTEVRAFVCEPLACVHDGVRVFGYADAFEFG